MAVCIMRCKYIKYRFQAPWGLFEGPPPPPPSTTFSGGKISGQERLNCFRSTFPNFFHTKFRCSARITEIFRPKKNDWAPPQKKCLGPPSAGGPGEFCPPPPPPPLSAALTVSMSIMAFLAKFLVKFMDNLGKNWQDPYGLFGGKLAAH